MLAKLVLLVSLSSIVVRLMDICAAAPCVYIHRKEGDIIMVDGLMNFFVFIVKLLCFYGSSAVWIVSREQDNCWFQLMDLSIIHWDFSTLFEKSNFCPKIQFWQNPNIFTSFSPKFFFDNFSGEIKVVNS